MAPPRYDGRYSGSSGSTMFRRPGPALRALLIILVVLAFANSTIAEYGSNAAYAQMLKLVACSPELVRSGYVWTLVTSGLVTFPVHLLNTLFTCMGLYFLSVDLEQRWGSRRYLAFVLGSVVAGNVLTVLLDLLPLSWSLLHPSLVCSPGAAITAVAVAWSLMNAELEVRLFFFLPVKGKYLLWLTVAYCVLGVIYPSQFLPPEGAFAPFAGIFVALGYSAAAGAGAPSPLRAFYLRLKLAMLRRKTGGAHLASYGLRPATGKRAPRSGGGPALHVVYGGLDDDGKPKDKRTLN